MPTPHRACTFACIITCILAAALVAAQAARAAPRSDPAKDPGPDVPPPVMTGFRADYLMELARLEERTLALARDLPEAAYAARANAGVHTIAECLTDLTAASRRVLAGMERPAPGAEAGAASDKKRLVADLASVLTAVRGAVEDTPDEGLEAPVDFLGRRWTVRALYLLLLSQMHEGLGHAAAHAEDHGFDPPWVRLKRASEATDD